MIDILRNTDPHKQKNKAWLYAIIIVVYATVFMVGGNSGDADPNLILGMDPVFILILQGIISVFMFIVFSLLFIRYVLKLNPADLFPKFNLEQVSIVASITISFMVINSAIGEWNVGLNFPDSAFEDWAKKSEEQLKVLTDHLTNFTSPIHFILALLVVGVVPAIGEELLFRGLLQNLFKKAFSNPHVAIWLSGFIFAAIHMQFYGVFPRMFLGVLFGYLFHWSGNLSLAMLAHLLNNGIALFLLYMANVGAIDVTPEQMETSAPWPAVLTFLIICTFLLRLFYKKYNIANG